MEIKRYKLPGNLKLLNSERKWWGRVGDIEGGKVFGEEGFDTQVR